MLAAATFTSVRSANRAARATERALLAGIRPVLVPSRLEDPSEKVGFGDGHRLKVDGGRAVVEVTDEVVYLAIALRNVGSGLAVLDRWDFSADHDNGQFPHREPDEFRRLTRDLYVPASDLGFWQGAFRDPGDPVFAAAREAATERHTWRSACSTATMRAASGRSAASCSSRTLMADGSPRRSDTGTSTAPNPVERADVAHRLGWCGDCRSADPALHAGPIRLPQLTFEELA